MNLFKLELKRALRAPRGRLVLFALLIMTLLACAIGGGVAKQHRLAGAKDESAARERVIASAKLPSPYSALYLSIWQDNFVARGLSSGAPLVAGELMSLPDAASVRLYEPPKMVPTLAERSPTAALLGTLDLGWILAFLLPLAAIALGFDSIAIDRERGTLAMLLIPARSAWTLVLTRALGLAAPLSLGLLPAMLIGAPIAARIAGVPFSFLGLLGAMGLVLCYIALLSCAVVTASALAPRSATALVLLFGGWLLLGVAVPLSAQAAARLLYPSPDPKATLAGQLAAAEVMAKPSDAVVASEQKRDPKMSPDLGEDAVTSQNRYDFFLVRKRYQRALGARYAQTLVQTRRAELIDLASWLSPTSLVSTALGALGGGGPKERLAFEAAAEDYRSALEAFVRERLLKNEAEFKAPQTWPKLARKQRSDPSRALYASALFLFFALVCLGVATLKLNLGALTPTKGDA